MSAETLRRAAALMRERAEAADAAPWKADNTVKGDSVVFRGDGEWLTNVTSARAYENGLICFDHEAANGEHIASWHPAVALAVADWLDMVAQWPFINSFLSTHLCGPSADLAKQALAVARAYLRESE